MLGFKLVGIHLLGFTNWFFPLLLCVLVLLLAPPVNAEAEDGALQSASEQESENPNISDTLNSPRATMSTFLTAMNDIKRGDGKAINIAITTFDLSGINALVRKERSRDLVWLLLDVMDRTDRVDLSTLSDKAEGQPYVFANYKKGSISIVKQDDGRWLFDKKTIETIEEVHSEVQKFERIEGIAESVEYLPWHLQFQAKLPASLKETVFSIERWRWLGLLLTVVVGVFADKLISWFLRLGIRLWRRKTEHVAFKSISDEILRPLGLMAMAIIWWLGINLLGLPEQAMLVLLVAVKFLAGVSGVWAAYRLVDLVKAYLEAKADLTTTKFDDVLVPLISRSLKIFVTIIGIAFVADNLNINISSLLAGLGLGGLAFALAAKDMVQNLFGSVTVLLDRTFSVGDWIVVGDVEGSVEAIGFRSTRVRTFYNSVVTVPNSVFITATVDNMGERRYRRMVSRLGLTYDTPPDKIEAFCEGVREIVRIHPYMRKDYFHVYFNAYADSALEIMVYVFWEAPDWGVELRERHRFLLDILRLAGQLGVEFAYPTQTLFMKQDETEGIPAEELTQDAAMELGRQQARAIVQSTKNHASMPPSMNQ